MPADPLHADLPRCLPCLAAPATHCPAVTRLAAPFCAGTTTPVLARTMLALPGQSIPADLRPDPAPSGATALWRSLPRLACCDNPSHAEPCRSVQGPLTPFHACRSVTEPTELLRIAPCDASPNLATPATPNRARQVPTSHCRANAVHARAALPGLDKPVRSPQRLAPTDSALPANARLSEPPLTAPRRACEALLCPSTPITVQLCLASPINHSGSFNQRFDAATGTNAVAIGVPIRLLRADAEQSPSAACGILGVRPAFADADLLADAH